ncbi:VTT domain-containing protein [Patescibacteria group bacterium]|nr:VTT domain-containing protein [Patescibacteria group bacterium]
MQHFTAIKLFLLISQYGYILLFPIGVIEGPVAAIVSGALVASEVLNAYTVFVILVAADITGDVLYYSLGRWGHVRFLERLSSRLGLTESRMKPLQSEFHKNDWKLILVGKTQGLGAIILYFAGVTHMRIERFLFWNFIGTLPKVGIFMAVGYLFGETLIRSQKYLDYFTFFIFGMGLLLLLGYWLFKRYMESKVGDDTSEESE